MNYAEVAEQPAKTTMTETPDQEWLRTSRNWYTILGQDMQLLSTAANAGDLESLYSSAKDTKGHIEGALNADSKLSPSAKYTAARAEYINSLEDIETAMNLIISARNEGWTNKTKIEAAADLMKKGNLHIIKFDIELQSA